VDKKLVIGNLKMYMNTKDVKVYLNNIKNKINNKNVILCPTSIYIPYFLGNNFQVGCQNIADEKNGASTGEVSATQVSTLGCKYVIIGHSERRQKFNESNKIIAKKINQALENELIPILCVGETIEQKENGLTYDVIAKQISYSLRGVNLDKVKDVIIAYEPIWAIGTGSIPDNEDIDDIVKYIHRYMEKCFNTHNNKVLYGGSVDSKNIKKLNKLESIDGYLIGSASTKSNELMKIIEVVYS